MTEEFSYHTTGPDYPQEIGSSFNNYLKQKTNSESNFWHVLSFLEKNNNRNFEKMTIFDVFHYFKPCLSLKLSLHRYGNKKSFWKFCSYENF